VAGLIFDLRDTTRTAHGRKLLSAARPGYGSDVVCTPVASVAYLCAIG
jgi:hypothetical protein